MSRSAKAFPASLAALLLIDTSNTTHHRRPALTEGIWQSVATLAEESQHVVRVQIK